MLLARVDRFDGELARIGVALEALAVDRRGAMVYDDVREVYHLLETIRDMQTEVAVMKL